MSSSISILLNHIEKIVEELRNGIKWRSYEKMQIEYEKLRELFDCLKSHFPEEIAETAFEYVDRHLHFIGRYIEEENVDMVKQNFDDIRKRDLPNIKSKIYALPETQKPIPKGNAYSSSVVFIVHGRDHKPMKELKAMLKKFGLKPMVLHEQPSGSRTIVEKLEKYANVVGYAFVILTPDDRGGAFRGKVPILGGFTLENSSFRARQNVILEFGYFIGKLGRDRVCCLYKGDVELPSDMHGTVYMPFKDSINEVKDEIVKELKEANYEI